MSTPKCDICGKPATNSAQDVTRMSLKPESQWEEYRPLGKKRFGCEEHQTFSQVFDEEGHLLGRVTDDQGRPIPR